MKSLTIATSLWLGVVAGVAAEETAKRDILRYPTATPSAAVARKTYGTSQDSVLRLTIHDFTPLRSITQYDYDDGSTRFRRYSTTPGNQGFLASPRLPSGALLTGVSYDLCDTDAASDAFAQILTSDTLGDNLEQLVTPVQTTGTPGCESLFQDLSAEGYVVDNEANQLYVDIVLVSGGDTHSFAGASVHYRLQVSPAPAVAFFGDVPTSHPFFQFIEALKASEVTGGCQAAPPLFCPDDPVTRGQMAVFLAKALGLHFP